MIAVLAALLLLDAYLQGINWSTQQAAGIPIMCVCVILGAIAFFEIAKLTKVVSSGLLMFSGLIGTIAVTTFPFWQRLDPFISGLLPSALLLVAVVVILIFAEQMLRFRTENALQRVAGTLLAVAYLGVGMGVILMIRLHFGIAWFLLFLAAAKLTDIGAYFTGSLLGKHKLIPWLSPAKTWEGLMGGLVFAVGVSLLTAWLFDLHELLWWPAVIFGLIVGVAGQFGDLCESLLKRSAAVKDSGRTVPEFGGVLDIIDSLLIAAPVAYVLLTLMKA